MEETAMEELEASLPGARASLAARDSLQALLPRLQSLYPTGGEAARRAWELVGLFYLNQGRYFEAMALFFCLYDAVVKEQDRVGCLHKAVPLVWIAQCYELMGWRALAKRYLMLTLCEDAVVHKGQIPADSGVYFRLVWGYGMSHEALQAYAKKAFDLHSGDAKSGRYPEWMLQEMDSRWMVEAATAAELNEYRISSGYVSYLISGLGGTAGKSLELLAEYLVGCIGCRTARRMTSYSTDYDVVCALESSFSDFRSELGRYFVCECKDWKAPADFTTFAKFVRVLDSVKSKFGILFAKEGISGAQKALHADREQLKTFQDRGIVIVAVSMEDLEALAAGENFLGMLRAKYEAVRLDLRPIPTKT